MLSISAVERDTGLTKDTLRVWERRYGFPAPQRSDVAERVYPVDQVEKLRVIKRLLDAGHRPGRIVEQSLDALLRLSDGPPPARRVGRSVARKPALGATAPDVTRYLDLVRAHDVEHLQRELQLAQLRLGLSRFMDELIVPLNTLIGDTWMRGHLEIFEEHFYTEALHAVLRNALAQMPAPVPAARPRVVLTTFPNEPHGTGLLMAELLFRLEGCRCISLGTQTPLWDIVLAATAQRADVVALSFTAVLTPTVVTEGLAELRTRLAPPVEIWAGGAAPVLHRRSTPGVAALGSLQQIATEIRRWRADRG